MAKSAIQIFNDKLKHLDDSEARLRKSYSAAERWLLARIIEEVLPELDVEDGALKSTNRNITVLTSKLNAVFGGLRTGRQRDIVNSVLKDMGGIDEFNGGYFGIRGGASDKVFKKATSNVETIMRKSLGFNPDGTIRPNSFIDGISKNDQINQTIREMAVRNIQGGNTIRAFTDELKDAIVTDKDGLGALNEFYHQTVSDRYSQYDRAQAKSFADELGMQAFIFSGGKVQDTRKFCCQRNGLVFTREEAKLWSGLRWAGKNTGYSPLIDMGGYNCRHSPQWISNRTALRRRPDLMVDEEGKLVPKTGESKQKLHRCA